MKTAADLTAEAKQRIREVTVDELQAMRAAGTSGGAPGGDAGPVLLDVREPDEVAQARVPGALAIPRGVLEFAVEERIPRERPVVVYCAAGGRSALAAETLMRMGYQNVASLRGGIRAWADAGGEVEG
jgi:rhodanese-related sulfurtransferase